MRIILLALAVGIGVFLLRMQFAKGVHWENHPRDFGTRDFIAYWAGYQAWERGLNPYDVDVLYPIEREAMPNFETRQAFLNPPWLFPLLAPVLRLSFPTARFVWLGLNVLFAATLVASCWFLFGRPISLQKVLLLSLPFLPTLLLFWMGQLSLFVGVFLMFAILALRRDQNFLAGILLFPTLVKPQLVFLVLLVLAFQIIREKRVGVMVGCVVASLCGAGLVLLKTPELLEQWLMMKFAPLDQMSATITTVIRDISFSYTGAVPRWPIFVVPLLGTLGATLWYWLHRAEFQWNEGLPLLILCSLIFTPYAWPHDFSLILVAHVFVVTVALQPDLAARRPKILCAEFLLQGLFIIVSAVSKNMGNFWFFPVLSLAIWLWVVGILKADPKTVGRIL